ncbi:MAG TPA: hypothetical protein VI112_07290 [Bacteroidia bacterium]|jgi:hypothetical protein
MKKALLLLLLFTIAFFSCKPKSKVGNDKDYGAMGYTPATVVDYEVDGCMWMIQTEDGKKYEPNNLPEDFRTDKKKVWVKYEVQKKAVTICMGGEVIKITDIKPRQ